MDLFHCLPMLSRPTVPPWSGMETVNTVTNINGNQQKVDWEQLQPVVTEPDPHIYACVLKVLQFISHRIVQCYACMILRPFGFAQTQVFGNGCGHGIIGTILKSNYSDVFHSGYDAGYVGTQKARGYSGKAKATTTLLFSIPKSSRLSWTTCSYMRYTALPGPTVCWVLRFGQPFTTITGARHGLRRTMNIVL